MPSKAKNNNSAAKTAAEIQFGKKNQAFQKQQPIMPTDPRRDLLRRYAQHKAVNGGTVIDKKADDLTNTGLGNTGLGVAAPSMIGGLTGVGGLAGAGIGAYRAPEGTKNKLERDRADSARLELRDVVNSFDELADAIAVHTKSIEKVEGQLGLVEPSVPVVTIRIGDTASQFKVTDQNLKVRLYQLVSQQLQRDRLRCSDAQSALKLPDNIKLEPPE